MSEYICPLCDSSSVQIIEQLPVKNIVNSYKKLLNKSFSHLFFNNEINYCQCMNCGLCFFHPMVTGDESFYNELQKLDWYYLDEKFEYEFASEYINETDKVLELGSGKGAFAKKISCDQYTGLDFSLEAKEMAKKNGVKILNETIEDHVKINSDYDVVVNFQVLEHVDNPKGFIENSLLALKKGGLMVISVPSESSFLKFAPNSILNMPPHHVTRWSDDTLKHIASQYNLDLVGFHHEKVQPIHFEWYLSTLISSLIIKKFGFSRSLFESSLFKKVIFKFSSCISKYFSVNLNENLLPNGHSVVVVYKKK